VLVQLDGADWRTFPADVVVRAGLRAGTELDRERARALAREQRRALALSKGLGALRHRDLSVERMSGRLVRSGVPEAVRNEAIGALTEVGLLDDRRFARNRSRTLAERGMGDTGVRYDLERNGIPRELIDAALEELEPEPARAERIVAAKGASAATARYLQRKGFSQESVESVLGEVIGW
jgi:SOS response regulatory protein OraA/RecX